MKKKEINKVEPVSLTDEQKAVDDYILQTLLFTPLFYIKTQPYVRIMVCAPKEDQPSMKIFRMIVRYKSNSQNLLEVSLQDEIDMIINGERDSMERWQVNFSIFVDKETYKFSSIKEKPEKISNAIESLKVFGELSKEKGSTLYAGGWRFQSDGNGWVRVDSEGNPIQQLSEATLSIEKL